MTLETAVRRSLVGGLVLLIAGSAVLGTARCADAAVTYVMIANLTELKKPNAFIDVVVDTQQELDFRSTSTSTSTISPVGPPRASRSRPT